MYLTKHINRKYLLIYFSHSYLVAHIEEKDREILKYKSLLKKYDQDYQILKAENDDIANVIIYHINLIEIYESG